MTKKFEIKEDISDLDLDSLMDFIEQDFHLYFGEILPVIDTQLHAASKIDTGVQNIGSIYNLFREFRDKLSNHVGEEKHIVFPIVAQIVNHLPLLAVSTVVLEKVFKNVESEHRQLGILFNEIVLQTENFSFPLDSSPTLKDCYNKLKQLHHSYTIYQFIEVNYLYPKLNILKQEINN